MSKGPQSFCDATVYKIPYRPISVANLPAKTKLKTQRTTKSNRLRCSSSTRKLPPVERHIIDQTKDEYCATLSSQSNSDVSCNRVSRNRQYTGSRCDRSSDAASLYLVLVLLLLIAASSSPPPRHTSLQTPLPLADPSIYRYLRPVHTTRVHGPC